MKIQLDDKVIFDSTKSKSILHIFLNEGEVFSLTYSEPPKNSLDKIKFKEILKKTSIVKKEGEYHMSWQHDAILNDFPQFINKNDIINIIALKIRSYTIIQPKVFMPKIYWGKKFKEIEESFLKDYPNSKEYSIFLSDYCDLKFEIFPLYYVNNGICPFCNNKFKKIERHVYSCEILDWILNKITEDLKISKS